MIKRVSTSNSIFNDPIKKKINFGLKIFIYHRAHNLTVNFVASSILWRTSTIILTLADSMTMQSFASAASKINKELVVVVDLMK